MLKISRQFYKIFPKKFGNFWKDIEDYSKIDNDLVDITNSFINSKSYDFVSKYWHILNINAYKYLIKNGYKGYGSTLARNYFTMTDLYDPWIDKAMDNASDTGDIQVNGEIFKKQNHFTYRNSVFYNYLCVLLYCNLKKSKYYDQLHKLQDKTFTGFDDPFIKIDGHKITTDKIVSLLDYEKINKAFPLSNVNKILEIGAGSGRLADAILSLEKNKKYVVCDIPPTIFISYKRLQVAFPGKKINCGANGGANGGEGEGGEEGRCTCEGAARDSQLGAAGIPASWHALRLPALLSTTGGHAAMARSL